MQDEDVDLVEQASDEEDDEDEAMQGDDSQAQQGGNDRRSNRLQDQANMEDEPPLPGYER